MILINNILIMFSFLLCSSHDALKQINDSNKVIQEIEIDKDSSKEIKDLSFPEKIKDLSFKN